MKPLWRGWGTRGTIENIATLLHIKPRVQVLLRGTSRWQVYLVLSAILLASFVNRGTGSDVSSVSVSTGEPDVALRVSSQPDVLSLATVDGEAVLRAGSFVGAFAGLLKTYVAERGDTVRAIASRFGVTPETITSANPGLKTSVPTGRVVSILPVSGVLYQISDRDSLASVAEHFGTNADSIRTFNPSYQELFASGSGRIIIPIQKGAR